MTSDVVISPWFLVCVYLQVGFFDIDLEAAEEAKQEFSTDFGADSFLFCNCDVTDSDRIKRQFVFIYLWYFEVTDTLVSDFWWFPLSVWKPEYGTVFLFYSPRSTSGATSTDLFATSWLSAPNLYILVTANVISLIMLLLYFQNGFATWKRSYSLSLGLNTA